MNDNTTRQTVERTTVVDQPASNNPQSTFQKKRALFRSSQIVWYILGVIEVLLLFRVILKLLGANPYVGFTQLIYNITSILVAPFNGILGVAAAGTSVFEWSTIIAGLVYFFIAWGIVYLLDIMYPVTPRDVH